MAGAIARAIASGADAPSIRVTTGTSRPAWVDEYARVTHESVAEVPDANLRAVDGATAVVLGVKPYGIVELAREISPGLAPGTLVVSVAGGITLETLAAALPAHVDAVRSMPNTPVAIHRGVTAIAASPELPESVLERAAALLAPTGTVEVIAEADMNAFSAIVGSGPAHLYYFVEALRDAAVDLGLSPELAARVVPAMVGGASGYLDATGREPEDLRREVTSPGGSTAEAVAVFDGRQLKAIVRDAMAAAVARSEAMGRES